MKEITKLKRTSPSDFTLCGAELLHTEECPSELVRFDEGILLMKDLCCQRRMARLVQPEMRRRWITRTRE